MNKSNFTPRTHQIELWSELRREQPILLKSDRQMGKTTALLHFIIGDCIENKKNVFFFSHSNYQYKILRDIIDYTFVKSITKTNVTLINGSSINFKSYKRYGIGTMFHGDIYIDDAEFMSQEEKIQLFTTFHPSSQYKCFVNSNLSFYDDFFKIIEWCK